MNPGAGPKPLGIAAEAASNNQGSPRSIAMGAQPAQPAPYDVQDTGQAGIKRVNAKGQNPLFTNADPAAAVQQMAGMKSGSIQMGCLLYTSRCV